MARQPSLRRPFRWRANPLQDGHSDGTPILFKTAIPMARQPNSNVRNLFHR